MTRLERQVRWVQQALRQSGRFSLSVLVFAALLVSACLPATPTPAPVPPTATATVTPTPTEEATIIWFPPTSTYTPFPTHEVSPTPDLLPALGEILLEDHFDDTSAWQTYSTEIGSVAYGRQELTLAVKAEKGTLLSLRQSPQFTDFYLEIEALPSLCREGDMYGLLLRANSPQDFYRLLINCNGQVRMERLKDSRFVVLQDWIASGQVLPGGMMRYRLGILALREEISVFINDVFHFSVRDTVWPSGQLGVFARAAGDTPLTVSFSGLVVYGLKEGRPPAPTTTPAPSLPPRLTPTP